MTLLVLALALCIVGMFASALLPFGRAVGYAALGAAGACAIAATIASGAFPHAGPAQIAGWSGLHVVLRIDGTSAFFLLVIGAIAVLVGLFGLGPCTADERRTGRSGSASACAIALASFLACTASDVLLFAFAWESLALAFFWAIAYGGTDPHARRAAYVTIVVTHAAGACMIAALLVLAHAAHGYAIDAVMATAGTLGPAATGAVLVLLLIGFGAKFGLLPMQVWMPYGYRAAPSLVAALMAGGALNVGFYGIARFVVGFPNAPAWFAVVTIALGAACAFFGIAWAAVQGDLRRLAAFSSVENAGLILASFGIAIAGQTLHLHLLVGFGIAAAFVQIAAHAVAKATLFLGIATVGDRSGSHSLDELGGLVRTMPLVALAILACGMSLAALPPAVGFVSEWMVLEALMQAFRTANVAYEVAFAISGAVIGVAAGIAIVTFTKVVGIGLLGVARSRRAFEATQTRSPWQLASLLAGIACIGAGGVCATPLLHLIAPSIDGIARVAATQAIVGTFPLVQPSFPGFASISALGLLCMIAGFTLLFWLLTRAFARPRGKAVAVWTSGEAYRPWTQYTGTGYVNPTRTILNAKPRFDLPFYQTIGDALVRITAPVRASQSGVIAAYLTYILAFTILLLILYPSIRHW